MSRKFTAQSALHIAIRNAGGLTFQLNDHAVRAARQSGEVREFTITQTTSSDFIGRDSRCIMAGLWP